MKYLYHYSSQMFDILKTREKQNKPLDSKLKANSSDYDKHISFFLEPIPLDILPDIHHNKHPFYVTGKEVYEYKIPTVNLGTMRYYLTESPEKTKALYDTSIDDDAYYALMDKVNKEQRYVGTKIKDIEDLVERFEGTTKNYFMKIPSYPNYEEIKGKYAPCVPHLMIYPETGLVKYGSVTKKRFGKSKTSPVNSSFLNW
jgi:hypothetical protein